MDLVTEKVYEILKNAKEPLCTHLLAARTGINGMTGKEIHLYHMGKLLKRGYVVACLEKDICPYSHKIHTYYNVARVKTNDEKNDSLVKHLSQKIGDMMLELKNLKENGNVAKNKQKRSESFCEESRQRALKNKFWLKSPSHIKHKQIVEEGFENHEDKLKQERQEQNGNEFRKTDNIGESQVNFCPYCGKRFKDED